MTENQRGVPPRHRGRGRAARSSARTVAAEVLAVMRPGGAPARELLDDRLARARLDDREAALATELVMGVVRHRLTLATILGVFAPRGWKRVDRRLQPILLLGAYQVLWLDGVPAFAAVDEAVEQAKTGGGAPGGRFVNALLRRTLREIEHRRLPSKQADPLRSVPIDLEQSCQFHSPVLPDPESRPVERLAGATSHPAWLVSRWASTFGLDRARLICRAGLLRPPLLLRPNPLRTDLPGLLATLTGEGVQVTVTPDGLVMAASAVPVARLKAFQMGLFQPQDRTAHGVVQRMALKPGQTVIDLCAGLGTKSTQMAEAMNNVGTVIASDKDERKLAAVADNAARLGATIIRTVPSGGLASVVREAGDVDWILLDVPCSNTGVLGRRPEARYRVSRASLEGLARLQNELLDLAAGMSGPRTRLMYSTCSLEPEENEQVSEAFARRHPGWRLRDSARTWPAAGAGPVDPEARCDGGYWAIWDRDTSIPAS